MDSLKVRRYVAGHEYSQTEPCVDMGTLLSNGVIQGDVDCSLTINAVDSLKILRYRSGLSYSQTEPCPDIGS